MPALVLLVLLCMRQKRNERSRLFNPIFGISSLGNNDVKCHFVLSLAMLPFCITVSASQPCWVSR